MSSQYLLQVPLSDQESTSLELVRTRLQLALGENIQPRPLPVTQMRRQRIRFEPEMETALADLARKHGVSVSEAASGMLYGLWLKEKGTQTPPPALAQGLAKPYLKGLRPGQKELAESAITGLLGGRVVLGEGSTGIGKSRVIVRSALAWLGKNKTGKVVICAPSLNVLSQIILKEWMGDESARCHKASLVVGRNQFISPDRVRDAIDGMAPDVQKAVAAWVSGGGKPRESSIGQAFQALKVQAHWIADDLDELVPGENIEHLRLTRDDPLGQEAEAVYSEIIKSAEGARVVFTTHASILVDARLRLFGGGFLPEYHCLLVDEAHEIEQMASNILSQGLSVQGLRLRLRQALRVNEIPHGCKAAVKSLLPQLDEAISEFHGQAPGKRIWFSEEAPSISAIKRHAAKWIPTLERFCEKGFDAGYMYSALEAAKEAINPNSKRSVGLRFTGVKSYPIIEATPHSLQSVMTLLWGNLDSAGLFSATLFTLTATGPSSGYIRSALYVPKERALDLPPAHTRWTQENVTVHLPDPDHCGSLFPPEQKDSEDGVTDSPTLATYHQAVADRVLTIAGGAAGGMLVLFTAYRELKGVADILSQAGLEERLIVQSRGDTAQALRARFLAKDQPAIWLGTGAAWTGLDLTDPTVAPSQDLALTDLVVTRLPAGREEFGIVANKLRAMPNLQRTFLDFRLRQGIGRVVRDPEHINRHVWVLDPRITSQKAPHPWLTGIARRTLAKYPNQDRFRVLV